MRSCNNCLKNMDLAVKEGRPRIDMKAFILRNGLM